MVGAQERADRRLRTPRGTIAERSFDVHELADLRRLVGEWAGSHAMGRGAAEELVLAINELATNSIRHGGGGGALRAWREHDVLLCEVQDCGYIEDPHAGRHRPGPGAHSGRGLWLVNQLCDEVEIRSSPAGTSVRVLKRLT